MLVDVVGVREALEYHDTRFPLRISEVVYEGIDLRGRDNQYGARTAPSISRTHDTGN